MTTTSTASFLKATLPVVAGRRTTGSSSSPVSQPRLWPDISHASWLPHSHEGSWRRCARPSKACGKWCRAVLDGTGRVPGALGPGVGEPAHAPRQAVHSALMWAGRRDHPRRSGLPPSAVQAWRRSRTALAVPSSRMRSVAVPARSAPMTAAARDGSATTQSRRGIRLSSCGVSPVARALSAMSA